MRRTFSFALAALALVAGVFSCSMASAQDAATLPSKATIPTAVPPVLPVVPSVAPGYTAPHVAPSAARIVGVTQQPFVGITLQDAVGMALLKNPNLAVSASNVRVARYQVVEAKAPFDLRFQVEPSSSFSVQPPENVFFAGPGTVTVVPSPGPLFSGIPAPPGPTSEPDVHNAGNIVQHQSGFQYGLSGETENGTQYNAGIQQMRTYNNITFNAYNPYYNANLNVGVTQPLLKNLGMNADKRQLKLALVNADNNAEQSLVDASNTISQVENAYWDLVAAWRNVAIQEDALKTAVAQQASNIRLAKRGAVAPIDAVESATQVANFQDDVFSALQNVSQLQNELKGLIVTNAADPIWYANLMPTSPVSELPATSDLTTLIAVAEKNRPEVQQAIDKQNQAAIDGAYAKNQELPQADVQAQYQSNGFAGLPLALPGLLGQLSCSTSLSTGLTYCPSVPGQSKGTMPYAYHNLWAATYPTFNINLTVSYPLQNDLAHGLKGIASEEQRQADVLAAGTASRIGYEARNALQSYQSALSRLSAARTGRESAEQVFASEQRRFKNGMSTTFLVLQRQVEFEQARGRELAAQTALNKSVVELQRVEGVIISQNGVNPKTMGSQALGASSPQPK